MADFPRNLDPAARYSELEQAYTEDRWSDVVQRGNALVEALAGSRDRQQQDLLSRAQLLIGHAHLYGLADARQARPHYQEVLASAQDANLRQLAEKALQSCDSKLAASADPAPASSGDSRSQTASETSREGRPGGEPVVEPRAASGAGEDSFLSVVAAAQHLRPQEGSPNPNTTPPWLASGSPSSGSRPQVEVDVVEEPELVEVAQADPSQAEELELALTRIRERRQAARQNSPEAAPFLDTPTPVAPNLSLLKEDPELIDAELDGDPELVGCLLRVVVEA
jgi:hypothetical protein